jgi:hypothetical protein
MKKAADSYVINIGEEKELATLPRPVMFMGFSNRR